MLFANFADTAPHDEIKFVISDRKDYEYAREIIGSYFSAGKVSEIIFSPVTPGLNPAKLVEWILKDRLDVRLQMQLHKQIWGNDARGR